MDTNTYNHIKKEIARYIPEQYCGEVLQDVLVGIYQREVLPKDIISYTIRACYRDFFSSNSTFARQKFTYEPLTDDMDTPDDGDEVVDIDKVISWVNNLEGLSWWEKQCFLRKILEDKTFEELSKEYRVSERQITYSFYKAKKIIQTQWQKRNQEVQ